MEDHLPRVQIVDINVENHNLWKRRREGHIGSPKGNKLSRRLQFKQEKAAQLPTMEVNTR